MKERKEKEMDTEKKIIIDIPRLEGTTEEIIPAKKDRLNIISRAVMIIFIITSLLIHTAIIANAVEYLKTEGCDILFSHIFPRYEKSEPMIPVLPEGNSMEDKNHEKNPDIPLPIRVCDLSANAEYGLALTNETSYNPDLYELLGSTLPNNISDESSPKVLIYHSHATEGYSDTAGTSFRSDSPEKNMVAIGKIITEVLERSGIDTIHLTELFDKEDWNAAYDNSNAAVTDTLSKYPNIQYVLDIHRDCIGNDEEGYVSASTKIYKKDTAQLMFVCGTDEGGSGHKDWRNNLAFAARLQASIYAEYPHLMRPINLRRASFYQDTRPCALILECGTCANTMSEAKRGAVLFACTLSDYIKGVKNSTDPTAMIEALCP